MDNNEPAFPSRLPHEDAPNDHFAYWGGMSLRDYFAAKAMQAYTSCVEWRNDVGINETAKFAYLVADAMLRAREAK